MADDPPAAAVTGPHDSPRQAVRSDTEAIRALLDRVARAIQDDHGRVPWARPYPLDKVVAAIAAGHLWVRRDDAGGLSGVVCLGDRNGLWHDRRAAMYVACLAALPGSGHRVELLRFAHATAARRMLPVRTDVPYGADRLRKWWETRGYTYKGAAWSTQYGPHPRCVALYECDDPAAVKLVD